MGAGRPPRPDPRRQRAGASPCGDPRLPPTAPRAPIRMHQSECTDQTAGNRSKSPERWTGSGAPTSAGSRRRPCSSGASTMLSTHSRSDVGKKEPGSDRRPRYPQVIHKFSTLRKALDYKPYGKTGGVVISRMESAVWRSALVPFVPSLRAPVIHTLLTRRTGACPRCLPLPKQPARAARKNGSEPSRKPAGRIELSPNRQEKTNSTPRDRRARDRAARTRTDIQFESIEWER